MDNEKLKLVAKGSYLYDERNLNQPLMCVFSTGFPDVNETRLEGESWLDMRKRTEPARKVRERAIEDFTKHVAEAFNKYKPQDNE